jgi:hypothetical protein
LPTCDQPSNLSESNITQNSVTLNWDPTPGAVSYDVDFNYAPFNSGQWVNIASGINATSLVVNGLNSTQWYTWRIRALCSNGQYSSYVASGYVRTNLINPSQPKSTPSFQSVEKLEINTFPSPSTNILNISINVTANTPTNIQVHNTMGEIIYTKRIEKTTGIVKIDVSKFNNGIYILRVNTFRESKAIKFIVNH